MQFYDATNKRAICQKIDRLCDSNDTSYPRLDKTAEVNDALERVVGWILQDDGTWQWDDSNYTDLPIGLQTLVEGQNAYTFNDKFLRIERVKVKDVNGQWYILKPLDQAEFSNDIPFEEAFKDAGLPIYYDKISDDTFKLWPAPSATQVTLTNGLKVEFRRTASLFTPVSTTTADTSVPGFMSTYHEILAYMAAIPYCSKYKKDRVALYRDEVMRLKNDLLEAYSAREKDKRKQITMSIRSSR